MFIQSIRDRIIDKLYNWLLLAEARDIERKKQHLKKQFKSCGNGVEFQGFTDFNCPEYAEIGNNVHIGKNAFIRARGGLKIGDNTHISRNLVLYTVNHQYQGKRLPFDNTPVYKSVEIGKNVWIGMNVCIAPGSKIGDGAIIGMGTVVSGEIPPLAIAVNQKCRIVGFRDASHYHNLDELEAFGGINGVAL